MTIPGGSLPRVGAEVHGSHLPVFNLREGLFRYPCHKMETEAQGGSHVSKASKIKVSGLKF